MNQNVRDRAIAEAARRNGVDLERLRFLQDNPEQVTSNEQFMPETYTQQGREVGTTMGSIGKRSRDPLERLKQVEAADDGLMESHVFEDRDGHRLTSRQMSMQRLQSYIPPAEPDLPGIGVKYLGPVTPQVLLDVGKASTMKEAKALLRKSNKGLIVLDDIPARSVALADYKRAHPGYDDEVGVIQVPTPELYDGGGIFEDLFGDNTEAADDMAARLDDRNAEAAKRVDSHSVFPELVAPRE